MREEATKAFQETLASGPSADWDDVLRRFPEDRDEIKRKLAVYRRFFPGQERVVFDPVANPGTDVSGYRILRVLGEGASGIAYLASHPRLSRHVVLKILRPFVAKRRNVRERFLRESRLVAKLSHAGIMPVEDVGETADGRPFLVMPFFPVAPLDKFLTILPPGSRSGLTRRDMIEAWRMAAGPEAHEPTITLTDSPWLFCARIGAALAKALLHAHFHGVVHRDVKPGNVLIRADGAPVFVDFGLGFDEREASLTMTGDFLGTPVYCPPEAVWGEANRAKDWKHRDLYGLAATLYELATGRPPYIGKDFVTTLHAMRDTDPVPALQLDPALPRDLAAILDKGVNKEVSARYASLAEFADDLEKFIAGKPVKAKAVGVTGKVWTRIRRHKSTVFAALLAVVGVLIVTMRLQKMAHTSFKAETSVVSLKNWLQANGATNLDQAKIMTVTQPDDPNAWRTLAAHAYFEASSLWGISKKKAQSNYTLAISAIEKTRALGVIDLTPPEKFILGQSLVLTERYTEAKPILKEFVREFPKSSILEQRVHSIVETSLGAISYMENDMSDAMMHFENSKLLVQENDSFPYHLPAALLAESGEIEKAIPNIEEGLKRDPFDKTLRRIRLELFQKHFPERYDETLAKERRLGGDLYSDQKLNVTFRAPFQWAINDDMHYESVVRYAPVNKTSTPAEVFHPPSVSLFTLVKVKSVHDLFLQEENAARIAEMGKIIGREHSSRKDGDENTVIDAFYDVVFGPLRVHVRERAVLRPDGTAVVLLCSAPKETFDKYNVDFDMALSSFNPNGLQP